MTCWPRASAPASTGRCRWRWRSPAGDTAALTQAHRRSAPDPGGRLGGHPQLNPAGTAAAVIAYPDELAAERTDLELVTRLRDTVIPPIEQSTHGARVRRRSRPPRRWTSRTSSQQAAAVHRDRGRAGRPAVDGRVPIADHSGPGRGHEPALDRRRVRRGAGRVRARLARHLFGVQPGPIDAFIPVLTFAIVFGLSWTTRCSWSPACTRNGPPAATRAPPSREGSLAPAA